MDPELIRALNLDGQRVNRYGGDHLDFRIYSLTPHPLSFNIIQWSETFNVFLNKLKRSQVWSYRPPELLSPDSTLTSTTMDPTSDTETIQCIAHGILPFGECIEEMWPFIFHLLEFTQQDPLAIQFQDNQGDVTIVECAHHLPSWGKNCNRIRAWFIQGKMHLIPPNLWVPQGIKLNDTNAILSWEAQFLLKYPCLAPKGMSDHWEQLRQHYTVQLNPLFPPPSILPQKTRCHVTRTVAKLITLEPRLVPLSILACASRDAQCMRQARNLVHTFPISERNQPWVTTMVNITRFIHAQWAGSQLQSLPEPIQETISTLPSPLSTSWNRGIMLTLGLELICVKGNPVGADVWPYPDTRLGSLNLNEWTVRDQALALLDQVIVTQVSEEVLGASDSEDWMSVDPSDMERWMGHRNISHIPNLNPSEISLTSISESIESFVQKESTIDGIGSSEESEGESTNGSDTISDSEFEDDLFNIDRFNGLVNSCSSKLPTPQRDEAYERPKDICNDNDDCGLDRDSLKSILDSLNEDAEHGTAGPARTLLAHFGLWMPGNSDIR
jgi:hypothetical protein